MVSSAARAEDTATASSNFSFKRSSRLLNAADFKHVFDAAQRSQDQCFAVLYRSNDVGSARLGFAVAKKVLPRAASRNRIRRICRESFRCRREHLGAVDIIILARRPADAADNAELFASLEGHWHHLREEQDLG